MIFRRALMRELTLNAVLTFSVLLAIVFTQILVRLLGAAAAGTLPADGVLGMLAFTALQQMPLLISVTLFISVLLTLSRAWKDSEMVVWMSGGQSLVGWIRPVLQFSLPLVILAGILSIALSPWAIEKRVEYQRLLEARDELAAVTPGLFQESRKDARIHFVEKINLLDGRLENIFIHRDLADRGETVVAKRGFLFEDPTGERYLILEDGRRYARHIGGKHANTNETVNFNRYGLRIDTPSVAAFSVRENARPTTWLLENPSPNSGGELFKRISAPISGLLLVFAAIPLAYVNPRVGRSYNLIFGIVLFFFYLGLMNVMEAQIFLNRIHWIAALIALHGVAAVGVVAMFYRRYQGATFWKYVRFWERNENAATLSR
jgi:lipopolysaccharide export system permease protein